MNVSLEAVSLHHPATRSGAINAPDASVLPTGLNDVSIRIASGEQVAVIGASGSGKTTLLHLIACAARPTRGRLALNDVDPWTLSTRMLQLLRGSLFVAPQTPPLPPRQRVVTAVLAGKLPHQSLWSSLRSWFYPVGIADAQAALARFDLAEKLFERVDRLSGGERQRVGLARALLSRAELFLVDEPLSALDPARAALALNTLAAAAKARNATFICAMHHVELALSTFPRVIALRNGSVVFDASSEDVTQDMLRALYEHGDAPAHDSVAFQTVLATSSTRIERDYR